MKGYTFIEVMILVAACLILSFSFMRRQAPVETRAALEAAGYEDITITGNGWYTCGRDFYSTDFRATNPKGNPVSGTVCCGLIFKGCTIRF